MIVQCAQCGTKYNLDNAKVRPEETKVKCSRCQYVFTVPLTLDEETIGGKAQEKDEDPFLKQWAKDFAPQSLPETRTPAAAPPEVAAAPPRAFIPPAEEEGELEENPFSGKHPARRKKSSLSGPGLSKRLRERRNARYPQPFCFAFFCFS